MFQYNIITVNIFGSNEGMALLSNAIDVPNPVDRASFFPRFGRSEIAWHNRIAARIKTKLVDIETGEERLVSLNTSTRVGLGTPTEDFYFCHGERRRRTISIVQNKSRGSNKIARFVIILTRAVISWRTRRLKARHITIENFVRQIIRGHRHRRV